MTTLTAKQRKVRRRIRITGWSALTSLLVTLVGFLTWFHIVLPADREATLDVYRDDRVVVQSMDGVIVMEPTAGGGSHGILYFPGAKVDPYSYLYPLSELSASGITVIIVEPLMNMALFDQRTLATLTQSTPHVTSWTLAGHSLGGVRACMLAEDPAVGHLVLFASYCANDLTTTPLDVVMVLGDNDGLIDEAQVRQSTTLLPEGRYTIQTVPGANHAAFGTYGPQPGDGVATVTRQQMRQKLTEILAPATKP
jgi:hypothetical protein